MKRVLPCFAVAIGGTLYSSRKFAWPADAGDLGAVSLPQL